MRNIILTLILVLFTSMSFANQIEATVIFENLTNKEFTSGDFIIVNLNRTTKINKTESFQITLPEKGKYQFSFVSEDFIAYTIYPVKINKYKNIITIRLKEKTEFNNRGMYSFPLNLETNLTNEQIEKRIQEGTLNFIMHGMDSSIPDEYIKFKQKYRIGLIKENCVIDPFSFKKATENNQMIFDYLNQHYGTEWLNELKLKPFGIK